MKADSKSLHARLYKFTYSSDLPNNLCPYFWKLVWGVIIVIPNFLIQLPILIYHLFKDKEYSEYESAGDNQTNGIGVWAGIALLTGYIYLHYHMVKAVFNAYSYDSDLATIGSIMDTILLLVFLGVWYSEWRKNHPKVDKSPGIVQEFIKAKYNNYCPKLEWDNEEKL